MKEYVYILSNSSMPGIVKIGRTNRTVEERIRELNSATGVPTPFVLEHVFETSNSYTLEYLIHKDLSPYRVAENREFFQISPTEAIKHISANYQDQKSSETIVLLYLRQGKWEAENLPEEQWSEKARHYHKYIAGIREQEAIEEKAMAKFCDAVVHEIDRYPRELWSPETMEVFCNIEVGNIGQYERAYIDRRAKLAETETRNRELPKRKMELYKEYGYKYIEDDQGKEISVFSNKHPDFFVAVQNREFIRRLHEL